MINHCSVFSARPSRAFLLIARAERLGKPETVLTHTYICIDSSPPLRENS